MRQRQPKEIFIPADPYEAYHLAGGMDKASIYKITEDEKWHYKERLKNYADFISNKMMDYDFKSELIDEPDPD